MMTMQNLSTDGLASFVAVVDTGSMTAAAKRLGVSKALVSRRVSGLEQTLSTTLLLRSTRALRLTPAGKAFYPRCVAILEEADEAYRELTQESSGYAGSVSVSCPSSNGASFVARAAAEYLRRHPEGDVDLRFSDFHVDPRKEDVDLCIRVGWLRDSDLRARKIGEYEEVVVCAPSLVAEVGEIKRPEQLRRQPWIANAAFKAPRRWVFSRRGERVQVTTAAHLAANQTAAVHACVLAGIGLSVLPDFFVAPDIETGSLVRVLPDWSIRTGGVYAVFPPARFRPQRVTAFVEVLEEVLAG